MVVATLNRKKNNNKNENENKNKKAMVTNLHRVTKVPSHAESQTNRGGNCIHFDNKVTESFSPCPVLSSFGPSR